MCRSTATDSTPAFRRQWPRASRAELEVAESLAIHDIPQAGVRTEKLAAMGLSLSIDDFGTRFPAWLRSRVTP